VLGVTFVAFAVIAAIGKNASGGDRWVLWILALLFGLLGVPMCLLGPVQTWDWYRSRSVLSDDIVSMGGRHGDNHGDSRFMVARVSLRCRRMR